MRNNNQPGVRGGDTGDRGEVGGGEGGGGEQPERGAARGLLALPEQTLKLYTSLSVDRHCQED